MDGGEARPSAFPPELDVAGEVDGVSGAGGVTAEDEANENDLLREEFRARALSEEPRASVCRKGAAGRGQKRNPPDVGGAIRVGRGTSRRGQ